MGNIFSLMRIPIFSHALSNERMKTIDEVRRQRLAMLRDECDGVGKLAERIGKSQSQVSQWLNASAHSETGKGRGMSDDICRDIENTLGKPRGWMDTDVDRVDARLLAKVVEYFIHATEDGQEQILNAAAQAEKFTPPSQPSGRPLKRVK
jgi:DNA-binding transcriptional ArsR family regulator